MSKKIDQLLNKISNYEKIALLSDRKSFLQALAQSATRDPISFERTNPGTRDPIDFERTSPTGGFDPALVSKYENLDEFGNPKMEGIPSPPPATNYNNPTSENSYTMPTTNIVGNYPAIDPGVQRVLSDLTGIPLATDGKIGDHTRKAIDAYKSKYNVGNLSDKELEKSILLTYYNQNKNTSNQIASK